MTNGWWLRSPNNNNNDNNAGYVNGDNGNINNNNVNNDDVGVSPASSECLKLMLWSSSPRGSESCPASEKGTLFLFISAKGAGIEKHILSPRIISTRWTGSSRRICVSGTMSVIWMTGYWCMRARSISMMSSGE